ncbi:MAG: hypothetical protein LBE79_08545, partial [Tannerella sp.]|nr:hypothetical protein [Tannerella sp.]
YQAGLLSEEKIAKLIASKFVFESSRKKDKSQQKPDNEDETAIPKRGENWERNLEMYQKGVRNNTIFTWISQNRNQYRTGKLADDKFDKLIKINFPFESTRSKLQDWDKNFEKWIQGERDSLTQWKDRNIKLYNTGKLEKEKIEKLREVGILK